MTGGGAINGMMLEMRGWGGRAAEWRQGVAGGGANKGIMLEMQGLGQQGGEGVAGGGAIYSALCRWLHMGQAALGGTYQ